MDLTTLLIVLYTLLYSFQTRSVYVRSRTSSKTTMAVGAGSGIVSVGPTFTGTKNGSMLRKLYVAGGAVDTRLPKSTPPKSLCTDAAHALR